MQFKLVILQRLRGRRLRKKSVTIDASVKWKENVEEANTCAIVRSTVAVLVFGRANFEISTSLEENNLVLAQQDSIQV